MTRCARCRWQPTDDSAGTDREQLRAHALQWAHPLCVVCSRSLLDVEPQTCERCLEDARGLLAGVLVLWQQLPRHLGQVRSQAFDRDRRGGSDDQPLPGGTVLALLAPGGTGQQPRRLTRTDRSRGVTGTEHLVDNRADSTPSVAWQLASWEDDWRHTRGEPAAQVDAGSTACVVRSAAGYLERHARWAANCHGAFAEYVADLRDLHSRLEVATGRVRRAARAGADCFDCGGALVRPVADDGLEVEHVVRCRQCGAAYDGARYLLALAAKAQQGREQLDGWVGLPAAALASRRPVRTLRAWLGSHVPWALRIEPREPTPDNPSPWRTVEHVAWYPALADRAARAAKVAQRGRRGA